MYQSKIRANIPRCATELLAVFFCDSLKRKKASRGFSLIELLIVMTIILIIVTIAVPSLTSSLYLAKVSRTAGELNALEKDIFQYQIQRGALPNTLADIGRDTLLDPWKHPYQYLNLSAAGAAGSERTDRFGVPLNIVFDLYSLGPDGTSTPSLTAANSQDDVVLASDGGYLGLASDF